jgi:hypothetical protein
MHGMVQYAKHEQTFQQKSAPIRGDWVPVDRYRSATLSSETKKELVGIFDSPHDPSCDSAGLQYRSPIS